MLREALRAGLPIITVRTTDEMNVREVLEFHAGQKVDPWNTGMSPGSKPINFPSQCQIFYSLVCPENPERERALYSALQDGERQLILVNPEESLRTAFDAGELEVPQALLAKTLEPIVQTEDLPGILEGSRGLTLKALAECVALTQAREGSLTRRGLATTRAALAAHIPGLTLVDTQLGMYKPNTWFKKWVDINGPYFLEGDYRLCARGALLGGPPGTGKSMAAKWLANEWKVPLYRLDINGLLDKFWGESEGRLARLLNILDQESPCVVLVDEIEKTFKSGDDQGITSRLLGALLWWMQERKSRIVVVLTTNDMSALPKELYRPGRVDECFTFEVLEGPQVLAFSMDVLRTLFPYAETLPEKWTTMAGTIQMCMASKMSHAAVVNRVYAIVKENGWKTS